ncbi:MAG: bifunctional metallophosphatase/5'-nucleotidase [Chitinophagaceae bacterium]|nr:bifunctional metallophosphatase/5'-nucleotidase [Chitinophagaceae bacterium]MCA6477075.1 bifunctional metallophosphatase/5'-nucleotidase [Chitinophagaceae bacterium]MCA6497872.1 bifunctional metallophosphatase/5'-nucleotidase [Chitinophagaceae bacterium]
MKEKGNKRRSFLKNAALMSWTLPATLSGKSYAVFEQENIPITEPAHEEITAGFTLLITSDIHAQLHTHDEFFWENGKAVYKKRGGLAVLKTMIDSIRATNPNVILYDGGDFFHGHGVASLSEGEALIPLINEFNYDLILPGNWEVVYKKKKMLYDMGHANAAKICANMWHKTNDSDNGTLIYPPYWIKFIAGAKVGFIGYTDHLVPKRQSPAYSEGIRFTHATENIAKYIKYLREIEGCGIIFIVTHMGLAQQVGLANDPAVAGADCIIGADTHERVREPIQGKYTKVVECGAFGSFLGKLEVGVKDGKLSSLQYQLLDVDPKKYPANPAMLQLVETAAKPYKEELKQIIGFTTAPLVRYFVLETPMDNLITDAIMWKFSPDIALSNGFRFCQPLAASDPAKPVAITKEFLWNMLPVDSTAKTGKVTGAQLLEWLEKELENAFATDPSKRFGGWFVRFAGMEVNCTIAQPKGKRVNSVRIKGQPLDKNRTYQIVACEREGDPDDTLCRIENILSPSNTGLSLHQIIQSYLAVHSPVSPRLEGRTVATDQPQTLLTQLQGTTYDFR